MKVYDKEQGKELDISDADLPSVVGNPRFSLPNEDLEFESPDGIRGKVSAADANKAIADGMKYIPKSQVEYENRISEAASKPLQAIGTSFLRGVTLGASDVALKESGLYTGDELKALEEGNPTLSALSDVAGNIAPALFTGGSSSLASIARFTPAAVAEFAGKQTAAKLGGKLLSKTTSDVAKKAVNLSVGSAIEAGLGQTGRLITEDAMGDAEFNAESALANFGQGALFGGALGLGSSLAFKGAEKSINSAIEKGSQNLAKFAESGDIGILKKLGAQKGDFKKILKTASLDEKELVDYALDVTKGFEDTADTILANSGITKKGGKTLKAAATASLDEIAENNRIAKEGAGKIMNSALSDLDKEFDVAMANPFASNIHPRDMVYGEDLAKRIEDEVLAEIKDIYSPRKAVIEKMAKDLRELGVVRDEAGNAISRKPLSPSQLKAQSVEFGNLAKWASTDTEGKQEVFKDLRGFLETKLEDSMAKLEGGKDIVDKYKKGKKLYQKAATLDGILQNGIARDYANNRGFSLTESILAGAGASVAGLPGAIAAYALRKGQREYGDVAASYLLRKIEKSSNKAKINISDAVDSFFNKSVKAANRYITGQDITNDELDDTRSKIDLYSQSPDQVVNNFTKNNEDLLNVAPRTSEAIQQRIVRGVDFLNSKLPRKQPSIFNDNEYSRSELLKFRNYVNAVEKPYDVITNLKSGYITPEAVDVLKNVYPKMYESIKQEFIARIPEFKNITEKQKADLSKILGIDSRKAFTPQGYSALQGASAQGITRDLAGTRPAPQSPRSKVPVTAAKNMNQAQRFQTGLDKTLSRS